MAEVFYGMSRGDQEHDVSVGASTPSEAVEVVIDDAKISTKSEILDLLDMIRNRILKDTEKNWS